MSKERDEIDWEKILDNPDEPKPEINKETLWVQLERMRHARNALPRWVYLKQLTILGYILIYTMVVGFMVQYQLPYIWVIFPVLGLQIYLNIDHFVLIYKTNKIARGETR